MPDTGGHSTARSGVAGWSAPEALSADGANRALAEMLRGGGARGAIYLRKTDGSEAIRLGDGYPEDLSPDGKWVLATPPGNRQHWIILPTGPGSPRTFRRDPSSSGSRRTSFRMAAGSCSAGGRKDQGPRIYLQDMSDGSVRAISPENVADDRALHDGRPVRRRMVRGRVLPVAGRRSAPLPCRSWCAAIYRCSGARMAATVCAARPLTWPPVVDRVDLATGRRTLWKTIRPADPVGVDSVFGVVITPGGEAYCHDYVRFLSELFVVEGLK